MKELPFGAHLKKKTLNKMSSASPSPLSSDTGAVATDATDPSSSAQSLGAADASLGDSDAMFPDKPDTEPTGTQAELRRNALAKILNERTLPGDELAGLFCMIGSLETV